MATTTAETNIIEFLHDKVDSFVKWDLMRFFHDNPHTRETAENIAQYTGRDMQTIEQELAGLVKVGVLTGKRVSGVMVYTLVEDDNLRQMLNDFMEACHDRQFRVRAIQYVIQGKNYPNRHDV